MNTDVPYTSILRVSRDFGELHAIERPAWPGRVWLHCDIHQWGLKEAKICRNVWPKFLDELVAKGYTEIYSAIPAGDVKLQKWQELFGLSLMEQVRDILVFRKGLCDGH